MLLCTPKICLGENWTKKIYITFRFFSVFIRTRKTGCCASSTERSEYIFQNYNFFQVSSSFVFSVMRESKKPKVLIEKIKEIRQQFFLYSTVFHNSISYKVLKIQKKFKNSKSASFCWFFFIRSKLKFARRRLLTSR